MRDTGTLTYADDSHLEQKSLEHCEQLRGARDGPNEVVEHVPARPSTAEDNAMQYNLFQLSYMYVNNCYTLNVCNEKLENYKSEANYKLIRDTHTALYTHIYIYIFSNYKLNNLKKVFLNTNTILQE